MEVRFTGLLVIAIFAVLVIGLFTLLSKNSGNSALGALGKILGFGFLLLLVVSVGGVVLYLSTGVDPGVELASSPDPAALSLQAEWEQLQPAAIPLEDRSENDSEPPGESQAKTVKAKRPDWVDAPPKLVGKVYSRVVSSGPYKSTEECHQALEPILMHAVEKRLKKLAGTDSSSFPSPERLGISLSYVLNEICRKEFTEELEHSFGDMKNIHVLMEFRAKQDKYLREKWQAYVRENRLTGVGVVTCLILAGLGLVYGLLKFDTWTRGYYTKRLIFGGVVVIIFLLSALDLK